MQNASDMTVVAINERNVIKLNCHLEIEYNIGKISKDKEFKMDTGAMVTCMNAKDLFGDTLTEEEFIKIFSPTVINAKGVDNKTRLKYYELQLTKFRIGTLEFGSVPIYVTFNEFATKRLLGMDLIGLLNVTIQKDYGIVALEKSNKFKDYQETKGTVLKEPNLLCVYTDEDKKNYNKYIDDLEAYKIRTMLR